MANNGNTTSNDIAQNLLDAFETIAKAEVNSAQFDKTVIGIIVSCEDAASGRYKVQYQDAIFYAYSSALDVTYTKGTSVQVRIPNNDFSGRKIIIGTADALGIDYGTIIEDPLLRYEYIGGNCISISTNSTIGSYWTENKNNVILYDIDNNINQIGLNTNMVYQNIKQGNSVILGADIKTEIPEEQRFSGNYGIKYTLTFEDITNIGATIDRVYMVDIDKMSGDPYAYDLETEQLVPFDVDSEHFLYVKKVELFGNHFPKTDDTQPGDIYISNLKFLPAYRIPEEEFVGTRLSIVCEEGNYFNAKENDSIKPAKAILRINGSVVDNTKQMEFYWFIEDLRVDRTSNLGYQKYGGRGWKCLNKYNVTDGEDDNPTTVQYISGDQILQVKQNETNARDTKYKCAVLYKGSVFTAEVTFTNETRENQINIVTDRNPNFIDGIGATTLTCIADDGVTYKWAKIDAEGGFDPLRDTTAENKEYEDAVERKEKLQQDIKNKIEPNNKVNQDLLDSYDRIINKYNNIERRKENKIINLQASSIFQRAVFKCQAFDKDGISLGVASQQVTNLLRAGEDQQNGWLTIENGVQVFRYNAKGIAPTSEQFEEPQVLLPLSFTLRNAEGIEIPHTAIRDTDVTWIVPTTDTMLKKYTGSVVSGDNGEGYELYNGKSLGYNINENYYSNKDNNEIELQVKYGGLLYIARTNFLFIKDGEDGTNGTEYVLKIIPNLDTLQNGDKINGRLKAVAPGQTGTDWLSAELWYNGIRIYGPARTNGTAITGKQVKFTWSMSGDKRATHNITVKSNKDNPPAWTCATPYIQGASDIVKLTCEYDDRTIVATQPIIVVNNYNSQYKVSLKKGTGFTHVTYSEDGLTPDYDNKVPFEIEVWKLINGKWGNITGDSNLKYNWSTIGNLKIKDGYTSSSSTLMVEPNSYYNSEIVNHAVQCELKYGTTNIGFIHIPIHFLLNRYGHSAINEWDGNSIQLDADGNTMLLAPQAGFGKKEDDNSYTGVLLGTVKDYTNNGLEHTGIFGYNSGTRTLFMNSKNGSAIFGSTGSAQIVIDPGKDSDQATNNHARLYSNDFYKKYDSKTGLPTSYASSNENTGHDPDNPSAGKGMLIDLTEPEIRWGNKNFSVDKNGYITAQGGGKIAGWKINDYRIDSTDNGTGSNKTGKTGMSSVYTKNAAGVTQWNVYYPGGNINKAIAFWAGGTGTNGKFHVAHDGYVRMTEATVGKGNSSNLIYIGNNTGSTNNSAIYTFNKKKFNASGNGFYIGTDGIGLGPTFDLDGTTVSNFQVTPDGKFVARNGYIGGRSKGWTVADTKIYNTKSSLNDGNDGVYIGTDGIALGKNKTDDGYSPFYVDKQGFFVARKGYIGNGKKGWTITDTQIYNGKTEYNTNVAGVYIGTDGIGIGVSSQGGSAFYVTRNGKFVAKNGFIGSSEHGWAVNDTVISNNNVSIRAGENPGDLAFTAGGYDANSPFWVKHDGSMRATKGTIAGWEISATRLTAPGKDVYLDNNGTIHGPQWELRSDGSASFAGGKMQVTSGGNLTINAGGMSFDANKQTQKINQLEGAIANITTQLTYKGDEVSTQKYAKSQADDAYGRATGYADTAAGGAVSSANSYTDDKVNEINDKFKDAKSKAFNVVTTIKEVALHPSEMDIVVTYEYLPIGFVNGVLTLIGDKGTGRA